VKYGNVYASNLEIKPSSRAQTEGKLRNLEIGDKNKLYRVEKFFEKPCIAEVSKQGLIIGGMRYILTPDIWPVLEKTKNGRSGEIWFLDAANALAQKKDFYAYEYEGKYFDTGSPESLFKTSEYFLFNPFSSADYTGQRI